MLEVSPAWTATYEIRELDPEPGGCGVSHKWSGSLSSSRFSLLESDEPRAVGLIEVRSAEPYKDDAQADLDRAAKDFCAAFAIDRLRAFTAVQTGETSPLEGARGDSHRGGAGLHAGGSGQVLMRLGLGHNFAERAEKLRSDPDLRASCDTFALAMSQADGPARLVTVYRLYDVVARRAMAGEPTLLSEEQIDTAVEGALDRLNSLGPDEEARLRQTLRGAMSRVRKRSRVQVLLDHLAAAGHQVDGAALRRLDTERGRYAHNPALSETLVDPEAMTLATQVVATELARQLDAAAD